MIITFVYFLNYRKNQIQVVALSTTHLVATRDLFYGGGRRDVEQGGDQVTGGRVLGGYEGGIG